MTAVNFATQLEATCPRVTENSVDINGIPNQEGARVDVAWMDVLFSSFIWQIYLLLLTALL